MTRGLEAFIQRKREFNESFEGLRAEPRLISVDGPDGAGKTTIIEKLIKTLKAKFVELGKNPEDIVYVKYFKIFDTASQKRLHAEREKLWSDGERPTDEKMRRLGQIWAAILSRAYAANIRPLLEEGKVVILDRSEVDTMRSVLEWYPDLEKVVREYYEKGTLTGGIVAGNRVFISASPEDLYNNLSKKSEPLTINDPKSVEECERRVRTEKEAEKLIEEIPVKGTATIIKIENPRVEDLGEREKQLDKLADQIALEINF